MREKIIYLCDECLIVGSLPCTLIVGGDAFQSPPEHCPWDEETPNWKTGKDVEGIRVMNILETNMKPCMMTTVEIVALIKSVESINNDCTEYEIYTIDQTDETVIIEHSASRTEVLRAIDKGDGVWITRYDANRFSVSNTEEDGS